MPGIHSRRVAAFLAAVALLGAAAAAAGQPAPLAQDAATLSAIDRVMENYRLDAHIPGMVWGVVKDGALVHAKGAGVQDIESKRPVTAETLFRIASMTKSFTAPSILKLRDEGCGSGPASDNGGLPLWLGYPSVTPRPAGSGTRSGRGRDSAPPARNQTDRLDDRAAAFQSAAGRSSTPTLEHTRLPQKRLQARVWTRRCVERRLECCPTLGIQAEALAVRQGLLGARQGALQDELADGPLCRGRRRLEDALRRWRESQIELLGTRNCEHLFLDPMIAGLPDIVMTEKFEAIPDTTLVEVPENSLVLRSLRRVPLRGGNATANRRMLTEDERRTLEQWARRPKTRLPALIDEPRPGARTATTVWSPTTRLSRFDFVAIV